MAQQVSAINVARTAGTPGVVSRVCTVMEQGKPFPIFRAPIRGTCAVGHVDHDATAAPAEEVNEVSSGSDADRFYPYCAASTAHDASVTRMYCVS